MKDNLNIEALFKDKLGSLEGEVSPDAWANIQQGMNMATGATTAAAKTGVSAWLKAAILGGGIGAATLGGIYLFSDDDVENEAGIQETVITQNDEIESISDFPIEETSKNIIQVMDTGDPVIEERREEIEREIRESGELVIEDYIEESAMDNQPSHDLNTDVEENNNIPVDNEVIIIDESDDISDVQLTNPVITDVNEPISEIKNESPSGNLTFETDTDFAPTTYRFYANAKNYTVVNWDFGDGTTEQGADVVHDYEKPGTYTVKMNIVGKHNVYEASQTIIIKTKAKIDNIPNVITPNGDDINDYFSIKTTDIETFYITIRDKNGSIVFESKQADFKWDGKDQGGNDLEKTRYTYMIFAKGFDGTEFKIPGQLYLE